MAVALDRANDAMIAIGLDYDTATSEPKVTAAQKKEKAAEVADKLRQYAKDHDLVYKVTEPMTYDELNREPIGGAFEGQGQGRSPVVNEVFTQSERGESRMPLYSPRRADLRSKHAGFAYWKIAEIAEHTMDFKDESVREKVIEGWKFDQARSFARNELKR